MDPLLLTVSIGLCAWTAVRPELARDDEADRTPARAVLQGERATIPFELPPAQPSPVVAVTIDDQGPFEFLVDTGAGACVIDTGLAAELGLVSIGTTDIGDPSGNERLPAEVFEAEVLALGGFRAEGVPMIALDRRTVGGGARGVLGLPLFHEHLLTIDYPGGVLHVADARLDPEDEQVVEYTVHGGLPRIELSIGTRVVATTVDTGSPDTFTLPASTIDGLEWLEPLRVVGRARTVNSEFDLRRGRVSGAFELAGHRFEDPWVSVNELFPHANLGYEVLGGFALSIDQRGRRMRFDDGGPGESPR